MKGFSEKPWVASALEETQVHALERGLTSPWGDQEVPPCQRWKLGFDGSTKVLGWGKKWKIPNYLSLEPLCQNLHNENREVACGLDPAEAPSSRGHSPLAAQKRHEEEREESGLHQGEPDSPR